MSPAAIRPDASRAQPAASETHQPVAAATASGSQPHASRSGCRLPAARTATTTNSAMPATIPAARTAGSRRAVTGARCRPVSGAAIAQISVGAACDLAQRGRAALAPPGPEYDSRVAEAVEQVVALLALAADTRVVHDRHLADAVVAED